MEKQREKAAKRIQRKQERLDGPPLTGDVEPGGLAGPGDVVEPGDVAGTANDSGIAR